ncbi:DnaB-like helicase C-terminal domain-containing protein [Polymorphobacter arshaanensis]|nr:DnaB-like helicase C-terminal domain-containing protein [Polymorphobacter arshaanensis]
MFNLIQGETRGLTKEYGLNEDTCRKIGLQIVQYSAKDDDGNPMPRKGCLAFTYRNADGSTWGQKIRYKVSEDEKTYGFPHAPGKPPLFLQHLWTNGSDKRSLMIFEGEGDAGAYFQVTGGKYPVVSIPTGAKGCLDVIKNHYEWIAKYEKIIVCFDGDATGREWAKKAAEILPPGKTFIGEVPGFKDARTALMAGDAKAIQQAFFNPEPYRPDGIFTLSDIREAVLAPPETGRPWWDPKVTSWTFGRRTGEMYLFGAGTGIGKTDWFTQSIAFDVLELQVMTAVIYLEQPPAETGKRIAGKVAGKAFHVPDGSWDQAELIDTIDRLEATGKLLLGGNFSSADWDVVKERIRYMVHAHGVQHVYLDHFTALVDSSDETASVTKIVKEAALLAQELSIIIHGISHLSTPEGKSHEEGGRVMVKHFRGSRALGYWAHYMFGLERNTQAEDPQERNVTTFRCLKDRYTGRANGNTMFLRYDQSTCQLTECDAPAPGGHKFEPDFPLDL